MAAFQTIGRVPVGIPAADHRLLWPEVKSRGEIRGQSGEDCRFFVTSLHEVHVPSNLLGLFQRHCPCLVSARYDVRS